MKHLTKNIIILLVIIFIADRGIGLTIRKLLHLEQQGESSKSTYAVNKVTEDVLVFGSSRAAHHYISEDISKNSGLTCFNVGRDGSDLSFYLAMLKVILAYHTPKIVVVDLNLNDFTPVHEKKAALISNLLPYIDESKAIEETLLQKSPLEAWKAKVSFLYRYNSLPVSILQHHLELGEKHSNGYEPLKGCKLNSLPDLIKNNTDYQEDPSLVREFEEFVRLVKERNIELHVVVSPSLSIPKYNCIATANRVLSRYALGITDYSTIFASAQHIKLFYDKSHMNHEGASAFTSVVLRDVLKRRQAVFAELN